MDGGWLAKNLKAEIDPELVEVHRGTVSLPLEVGKTRLIAVELVEVGE